MIAPSTFASFAALPAESAAVGSGFVIAPDPETALRAQPAKLDIDLDEPLYDERDARASLDHFRGVDYDQEIEVARASTPPSSMPATSWARRSSAFGSSR